MRVIFSGFGVVGQGLAQILGEKADDLRERYGFEPQIVGVITGSRGTLYQATGLDRAALLAAIRRGHLDNYPDTDGLQRDLPALDMIRDSAGDVLVEVSPTNLQTAQPALDYCYAALDSGKHVVTANKGPIAVAFDALTARAQAVGKSVLYEGTVMAGTPTLRLAAEGLAGCRITEAKGILNGTTNYILTQMELGMSYTNALKQAQELGYAETDPTADVEGWDAAAKVMILARALFGKALTLGEIAVRGITHITEGDIQSARASGERWKLIAHVMAKGAAVEPVRLPITHPLAGVSDATNAITFTTDLLGEVTLIGPGAGQMPTGFALLADLLAIYRSMS